jgi:hypothetical protein
MGVGVYGGPGLVTWKGLIHQNSERAKGQIFRGSPPMAVRSVRIIGADS